MWSRRSAGAAARSDRLSRADGIAFLHIHLRKMEVERKQPLTVIYRDHVAVVEKALGQNHPAAVDGFDRGSLRGAEVGASMRLRRTAIEPSRPGESGGQSNA